MIMKLFVLIVTITAVWCYSVEKVKEINGAVSSLVFDAADNTFVIAHNESDKYTFYKLNSTSDVILSQELTSPAYVLVNQFGDAYIFPYKNELVLIRFLQVNTTSVEPLAQYIPNSESGCPDDAHSFIDNDDIIYINQGRGVSYLRARENVILGVEGLQGSKFCTHAMDANGDVYLQLKNMSVVVITKKEKNSKILHSKIVSDSMGEIDYIINGYGNRVFGVKYGAKHESKIQMLQESSKELLFLAYDVQLRNPFSTKEHFVFFSYDEWAPTFVYILAPHRNIQKISHLLTPSLSGLSASDSEGHIFYSWHMSYNSSEYPDQFGIFIIKPLEQKVEIRVVPSNSTINSMLVDVDDNLWMIADGLYMLPKGTNAVTRISDLPVENSGKFKHLIHQKKLDKEILIGLPDGLYICKN